MSEILLTPRPEPISPIDPDIRPLARAPSQSTEFFNAVFVDSRSGGMGVGEGTGPGADVTGGTRPLRVMKKKLPAGNDRSSTVSVPSSPLSMRSTEHHPHQSISKLFMKLDLDRNPSITSTRPSVTPTIAAVKPAEVLTTSTRSSANVSTKPMTSKPTAMRSVSDNSTLPQPKFNLNKSTPLTPPWTPNGRKISTTVIYPVRSHTSRPRVRSPITPVTPSRAPAKALQLLGTQGPPITQKRRRDRFGALPEIEKFFSSTSASISSNTSKYGATPREVQSRSPTFPKMRSVSDGTLINSSQQKAKTKAGTEWFDIDIEDEDEDQDDHERERKMDDKGLAWLSSDPSVRGGRFDIGRYTSDEDEDWTSRAFSHTLPPPKGQKRVDESFVDLFNDEKESKSKFRGRKTTNRTQSPSLGKVKAPAPHPWSAAALIVSDKPPALVPRRHQVGIPEEISSSGSSSGPPSPASDVVQTPPKRPKKRPPPLVLDVGKPARLPIIILNSPPAHILTYQKKPMTPTPVGTIITTTGAPASETQTLPSRPETESSRQSVISQLGVRTPFVHPRRAPRPVLSAIPMPIPIPMGEAIGRPRALDLTKAALPRTTDTRTCMPLLPPLQLQFTPEDEYPISVFEPVTPTDTTYPGGLGLGRGGDRKGGGGWLMKVVRDFGQSRI